MRDHKNDVDVSVLFEILGRLPRSLATMNSHQHKPAH